MSTSRRPRRRPGLRAALLLAIGVAIGFTAYHALRSFELSRASATTAGGRHAPLGDLHQPECSDAGIAVHGSPSTADHAVSHGCARVHHQAMDLPRGDGLTPVGAPVRVRGR